MSTRKSVIRSFKNVVNGYSPVQALVRNATSNDPSGPTTAQMADVANHTYETAEYLQILDMIDRRLNDKGKNWRHVAKSLTLLDYLVRYGSDDVVLWAQDNLYIIKTLREFQYSDISGHDQGAIIRVKAKELTSLLKDDERLRQERELARQRLSERRNRPARDGTPVDEYDEALEQALQQSKLTAEEEERRRRNKSDDSLDKAIQLSLEEEEMRKKNQNLLDLDDTPQAPQVFGYYQQGQDQGQIIGYDMMGNPVYASQQAMNTGYLQNAYDEMAQQQLYEQQLAQQQAAQQQAAQQQAAQQQAAQQQAAQQQYYLQQQQLYQQQLAAQQQAMLQQQQQQQQMMSMQTGSNNPFAMNSQQQQSNPEAQPVQQEQPKPQLPPQPQEPLAQTPTGIQRMNEQYSQLNNLLASGTGIDTFGNTGETRIPAQHTKTGTFINSAGTGYRQETSSAGNPFLGTQYTGIPSTSIVPSYTGYGFGNQPVATSNGSRRQQGSSQQGASLIDL